MSSSDGIVFQAYGLPPTPDASTKSCPAEVAMISGTLAACTMGRMACVTGVHSAPISTGTCTWFSSRSVAGTPTFGSQALSA